MPLRRPVFGSARSMTQSEYRFDPFKKVMVAVVPKRSRRPQVSGARAPAEPLCPFDRGHEALTPPAVLAWPSPRKWRVRAFENLYHILSPAVPFGFRRRGDEYSSPAEGRHEVIVESPDHANLFQNLPASQLRLVFRAYQARFRAASKRSGIRYVFLFKNHGKAGGASIAHEHAQLLALPFVPELIEREERQMKNHYSGTGACLFEHELLAEKSNWVDARAGWVSFVPSFGRFPGELWVAPRHHVSDFAALSAQDGAALMELLRRSIARVASKSTDYVVAFHSFPENPALHFHAEIYPRSRNNWAGVEYGTGLIVNASDAAAEARDYRKLRIK